MLSIPKINLFPLLKFSTNLSLFHGDHFQKSKEGEIIGLKKNQKIFEKLKKRLSLNLLDMPNTERFDKLLKMIYEPDEAEIVSKMKMGFNLLSDLSKTVKIDEKSLSEKLDVIARKGLIQDIEINGKKYYMVPEFVVGWFEFSAEAAIKNKEKLVNKLNWKELMDVYYHYGLMEFGKKNSRKGFIGVMRTTIDKDVLSKEDQINILDYETTRKIVESAKKIGVLNCVCKELSQEIGIKITPDDVPTRHCMVFDRYAEGSIKSGISNEISKKEALELLDKCQKNGYVQTAENVKNPGFICNCNKEYCGIMVSMSKFGNHYTINTSNFISDINLDKCKKCGACIKKCPINIISKIENGENKGKAKVNKELCIGCGVCKRVCKYDAISMKTRKKRVYVPEDIVDFKIRMAFERGKLNTLIFNDPNKISHDIFRGLMKFIETNPFSEKIKNIEPLKSKFLNLFVEKVRNDMKAKFSEKN